MTSNNSVKTFFIPVQWLVGFCKNPLFTKKKRTGIKTDLYFKSRLMDLQLIPKFSCRDNSAFRAGIIAPIQ